MLALVLLVAATGCGQGVDVATAQEASADAPAATADPQALALELELARDPDLYLVIDLDRPAAVLKARGLVLEEMPLDGATLLAWRRGFGEPAALPVVDSTGRLLSEVKESGSPARVESTGRMSRELEPQVAGQARPAVPVVWTVKDAFRGTRRQVIAPPKLRPYDPDATAEPEPATPADEETPEDGKLEAEEEPAVQELRLPLDSGWELRLAERLPPTGFASRLRATLADGWDRLWGEAAQRPPLLALAAEPEVIQRLHHSLTGGTRILLTAQGEIVPAAASN